MDYKPRFRPDFCESCGKPIDKYFYRMIGGKWLCSDCTGEELI